MTGTALSRELGTDGILIVTLDVPGARVNTLNRALVGEFLALLAELESGSLRPKAVVLRSGKPDNFIAGADILEFLEIRSALEGESVSRAGQALLGRLEALPVPVVAAIHGSCLGGGLETALACRYRLATSDVKTVLGLPEVSLGLIPGAGGTQRLPRLVGLRRSLDLILTGRPLKASRALRAGIVDEVVAPAVLLGAARQAAHALAEGKLGPRRAGPSLGERLLRPLIHRRARASVLARAGRHYPAPLRALDVVCEGTVRPLREGLGLEARAFGELAVSPESRNLVSVFLATQEIKRDAGYPEGTRARDVGKLGVLGAGLMGAGIAGAAAESGVAVRMKDAAPAALGRGLAHVRGLLEQRRMRGSLSRLEVAARMDRISPTLDYSGFRRADLVIEAVFEDLEVKRAVLAEAEAATTETCVLASNTSSIPIAEIAHAAAHPERILGMHFFSPVHKMPLLEVAVTPETDAWATATAVAFGRRLGKHVIVVRDGPGFYTSRILAPYLNEAARLLEEGACVEDVDAAMTSFGFPVGPLTLLDEVGIDVGAKVAQVLQTRLGERLTPPGSLSGILADGRLGRKNKRGFYTYNGPRKKVDHSIDALLPPGRVRRSPDPREIQDRLVFAFLNEATLCLQEGILRSPRDGDLGALFGLGFPPFLGGPFRYLDHLGARFVVEVLERLWGVHGERYCPSDILVEKSRTGAAFHAGRDA